MTRSEARDVVSLFQLLARVEAELLLGNVGGIKQQVKEATRDNCVESLVDLLSGTESQTPDVDVT